MRALCLILFSCLLLSLPAYSDDRCDLHLINPKANSATEIGIGAEFEVKRQGQSPLKAYLLGLQDGFIYFVEKQSKQILKAPLTLSSLVSEKNNSLTLDSIQPFLNPTAQTGHDCVPHALGRCLTILKQLNGIRNLALSDTISDSKILISFLNKFVSAEARAEMVENVDGWRKFFVPGQNQMVAILLKNLDVKFEQTTSVRKLRSHLAKGFPVLITNRVKLSEFEISDLSKNTSSVYDSTIPAKLSEAYGAHGVAAIGIIEPGWFKDPMILVLDSSFGNFEIWNLSDIKKSLPIFTLLSP